MQDQIALLVDKRSTPTVKTLVFNWQKKIKVEADVIVPIPDSGVPAALGYSEASGVPFELGIIRNHYIIGRTFIEPSQSIRQFGVKLKHSVNKSFALKEKEWS